jgi:Leucine-rich repeat (LRR) protein
LTQFTIVLALCAVQITAGSLPKGLHSLDLSRNSIAVIEGLRELTRLRVLNLSYNRISRIGHGKQASMSLCSAGDATSLLRTFSTS